MQLFSSAFQNGMPIPSKYTCDGKNTNPPLEIHDVPANAKSLALIMDDPDAPMKTWLHWTIWNIHPQEKYSETDWQKAIANAQEGLTDFGTIGYGGPCPPSGTHRYFFKLFALDTLLDLKQGASLEQLTKTMEGHSIEKTELMGTYTRKSS